MTSRLSVGSDDWGGGGGVAHSGGAAWSTAVARRGGLRTLARSMSGLSGERGLGIGGRQIADREEQLRQFGVAIGSISTLMAFEPGLCINLRQCRLLADAARTQKLSMRMKGTIYFGWLFQ